MNVGGAVAAAGLGLALTGLFALPVQDFGAAGPVVGVEDFRQVAATASDQGADNVFGSYADAWWQYGVLAAVALLTITVALMAFNPSPNAGRACAALAVLTGILHVVAVAKTKSFGDLNVSTARSDSIPSAFDHAGIGIWIGIAGLAVIAAGGIVGGRTAHNMAHERESAISSAA